MIKLILTVLAVLGVIVIGCGIIGIMTYGMCTIMEHLTRRR